MKKAKRRGVCGLCRRERELVTSHLLPASIYRLFHDASQRNPNPIVISGLQARTSSRQIEKPFLCAECEDRFNKRGEKIIAPNCARVGGFPLIERLRKTAPILSGPDYTVYDLRDSFDVRADMFRYFAVSVFWRASATLWKDESRPLSLISLGKYEEGFRRYLMEEDVFPSHASIVLTVFTGAPELVAAFPDGERRDRCHHHQFYLPGMTYSALVGSRLPEGAKRLSMYSPAGTWVVCAPFTGTGTFKWLRSLSGRIQLSSRLSEGYGQKPRST